MGLMVRAMTIRDARLKTLPESRGPAVVITGDAGDHSESRELWGPPGLWSMPPDGTDAIRVPVGENERFGVIAATHHYKTPRPTLSKGETAIGSTSSDGVTIKALTIYKDDGTQELNGNSKRLVTWGELNTALSTLAATLAAHVHPSNGTVSPGLVGLTIDITAAKTLSLKTGG